MSDNPLLISYTLPPFSSIHAKHVNEAIRKVLNNCYSTVDQLISAKHVTWDTLYYPLMLAENELQRIWSPIVHLNSVKHNLELRKVYEESLLLISEYRNWISQHYGLYKAYTLLRNSDVYQQLSTIQKKVLNNILYDFKLSGICLSRQRKKEYARINSRLSQLSVNYANNVFDSTLSWKKLVTEKRVLSGIPSHKLEIARLEAQAHGLKGWLFTLKYPSYSAVLTYCDTKEFREELYWAFNTRASDQGPNGGKWDNTLIMDEILSLRHELAQILGFNTYLEKSLEKKMIQKPEQAFGLLTNLFNQIRLNEYQEFIEIQNFAKKNYSCMDLKPWDIPYYKEKQKQHIFSVTSEELRCYFPEKTVLNGMFTVANLIYGISIKERYDVEVWSSDVRFFDIFDEKDEWRGGFYLDMYIRDNKHEGAWMDDLVSMMYKNNAVSQKPIACLTCNFDCSVANCNIPILLTHHDAVTLFHEFGHVLHHVMTCIDIPEISGINGVPWDAIELPSQFMEKFCWENDVLRLISMHYKTKQSLPDYIMDGLLKMKTYHAASYLLRQVIYGLFDLRIHHEYIPGAQGQVLTIFNEIIKKISMHHPTVDWDRFPHSFLHIFSNDYAGGYYSYLWADILASNVWYCFKKIGVLNPIIGKLFLNNILSVGGSIDLKKYFVQCFGQLIRIEPMLQYYGISVDSVFTENSIY